MGKSPVHALAGLRAPARERFSRRRGFGGRERGREMGLPCGLVRARRAHPSNQGGRGALGETSSAHIPAFSADLERSHGEAGGRALPGQEGPAPVMAWVGLLHQALGFRGSLRALLRPPNLLTDICSTPTRCLRRPSPGSPKASCALGWSKPGGMGGAGAGAQGGHLRSSQAWPEPPRGQELTT